MPSCSFVAPAARAPPPHAQPSRRFQPRAARAGCLSSYAGPSACDRDNLRSLLSQAEVGLEEAVARLAAAGECREGLLEAGLQALQAARAEEGADVGRLERVCRLAGAALARSALPPLALLLDELLSAAGACVGAGEAEATLRSRVREALASGRLRSGTELAAAAENVAQLAAAQERQGMAAVAAAVEESDAAAQAALAAAERRRNVRELLGLIASIAKAMN